MERLMKGPLNHPFASVAVAYVGFVVFIWYYCWAAVAPAPDYVAAGQLVTNHRIVAGDLRRPDTVAQSLGFYMATRSSVEGKYVKTKPAIIHGQFVQTAALADKPDMQLPDKMRAVVFALPADSRLIGLLDVGSPVVLLGRDPDAKASLTINATVHAILCEPTKNDPKGCNPVLRIPEDQIQIFIKNQAALRLAIRSDP